MRWFKPFLIINEHWSGVCVSKITWICIVKKNKELFIKNLPFDTGSIMAKVSETYDTRYWPDLAPGNWILQEVAAFYWTEMFNKYTSQSIFLRFQLEWLLEVITISFI